MAQNVQGKVPSGQPAAGANPILVGGKNPSNNHVSVLVDAAGNLYTTLYSAISSDIDSIDIGKMSNDGVTVALNAVTATTTSAEIPIGANGFKHVAIYLEGSAFTSGNFAVTLTGSALSGGSLGGLYKLKDDGTWSAAVSLPAISTNATFVYIIPNIGVNYLKITATRTTDGTLTARVVPFN